jgi:hypothetical protein
MMFVAGLLSPITHAETWLPLDKCVTLCSLIVKCTTEVTTNQIRYKIEETWKGNYSPDLFYHRPPDGYLYAGTWHGNDAPTNGRVVVFFFTKDNQPSWCNGRYLDHSTCFVVNDGKLIYADTDRFGYRKEYAVDNFKKEILGIVEQQNKSAEPSGGTYGERKTE